MSKLLVLLIVFGSLLVNTNTFAQNNEQKWALSLNAGSSLLWGDGASADSPFSRWFSPESGFTLGLRINRNVSKTFSLYADIQKGYMYGERKKWSSDLHPTVTSNIDYFDYHVGFGVDFTSMFGVKTDRLMSVYGFAGVGMVHYDATSMLGNIQHLKVSSRTLMIPYGIGLKFRLNNHFNMFVESNFRTTFVDDIDAYVGSGTDINDVYSITSIGITYSFGKKKLKTPKLEEPKVDAIDDIVAIKDNNVDIISNFPDTVAVGEIYPVKVIIDGDVSNLVYFVSMPDGVELSNVKGNFLALNQDSTGLILRWDSGSFVGKPALSYDMLVKSMSNEIMEVSGHLEYKDGETYKMKSFKQKLINSKPTNVIDNSIDIVSTDNLDSEDANVSKSKPHFVYAIQVATVFGGTTSESLLQKRLKLDVPIGQAYYKNSARYIIGQYSSYGEAVNALSSVDVHGAYIVVFKDGKYNLYLSDINADIMDQNPIGSGTVYKVQIAASKNRPYSIAKLAYRYGFQEADILEEHIGHWYFYTIGYAQTFEHAKELLRVIKMKKSDAYIIKYIDEKR